MKTVQVSDDWCEDCRGRGTRTLHGIAITSDEFNGPDWNQEMRDDYFSGAYDTRCEMCGGTGKIDPEEYKDRVEMEHMMRMEAPHMFQ